MAYGGGAAVAAAAALAQAIKASGAIVKLHPDQFMNLLNRAEKPLIVIARGGWLNKNYKYIFSYKGLFFYTMSSDQLMLPGDCETVQAGSIWIP